MDESINTDYIKVGAIFPTVKKVRRATNTIGAFGVYQSSPGVKLETLPARNMKLACPICGESGKWWLDEGSRKAVCDRCNGVFTFHRKVHPTPSVP